MTDRNAPQNERTNERTNGIVHPATARLARVIVAAIDAPSDPRSADLWAVAAISSAGALRDWCRAAHVHAHDALSLARGLRAVVAALEESARSGHVESPETFIDIVDKHYRADFMSRCGLEATASLSVATYLEKQRFIRDSRLLALVEALVRERSPAL